MVNVVVVTHGEFGAYLVEAAESIVGRQAEGVRVVPISSRLSVPEIQERIGRAAQELHGPDGVIFFVDMPGGTPANMTFPRIKELPRAEIVSGVNLNMLVSAFSHRSRLALAPLVEKIITDGQRSIRDIRQMFLSGAGKGRG